MVGFVLIVIISSDLLNLLIWSCGGYEGYQFTPKGTSQSTIEVVTQIIARLLQIYYSYILVSFSKDTYGIWKSNQNKVNLTERLLDKYEEVYKSTKWNFAARKAQGLIHDSDDESTLCCSLCLCEFKDGNQVTQLPCHRNHVFHTQCFKSMIRNGSGQDHLEESQTIAAKCPLCRQVITPDSKNKDLEKHTDVE